MVSWFVDSLLREGVDCRDNRRWPCHSGPVMMFGDKRVVYHASACP